MLCERAGPGAARRPVRPGLGRGRPDRGWRAQPEQQQERGAHARDPDPDLEQHLRHAPVEQEEGDGGGAIYGCRSAPGREPCVRANNLENGRAFEFQTTSGTEGGFIDVGTGTPNTKAVPFNTNAAARVANLNADRVDDLHASEIVAQAKDLWAVVGGGRCPAAQERRRERGEARHRRVRGRVRPRRDRVRLQRHARARPTRRRRPAGEAGASQRAGNARAVAVVTRDSAGDEGRPAVPPDGQLLDGEATSRPGSAPPAPAGPLSTPSCRGPGRRPRASRRGGPARTSAPGAAPRACRPGPCRSRAGTGTRRRRRSRGSSAP